MTKNLSFFKFISLFFSSYLFAGFISGVLTGTSYIPFKGWALLFCYIPLWVSTLDLSSEKHFYKKVFFSAWLCQFTLTLIGFNWIYYVSSEFGHLHWTLSLGALILFAGLMHLYIPISVLISVWLFKRFGITQNFVKLLILALSLALLERIWPSIFEWNLAYTLLWIKLPIYQWADTVGFWGLSTLLYLTQAGLAAAYLEYKTKKLNSVIIVCSVFALLAALSVTGSIKGKSWSKTDESAQIAIAQGNIGNAEKLQSEKQYQYHSYIRSLYTDLTTRHLASTPSDLMIWPETAMPFAIDEYTHNRIEQNTLLRSISAWNIPVVTGGYSVNNKKTDHLGYPLTSNAVFYLSPQMNFSDKAYSKTNLLVFGEYLPFGEKYPSLYKLFPFVGVYDKGSGPVVASVALKEKIIKLGPQICYDSLDPSFSRGLALNGAQVLFNVTNDSWFGWWAEPYQHGVMTLARAIEVRRPLVRSTNTGISWAILADGTTLQNSPINESWAYTYDIKYNKNPRQTFYTEYGYLDWIVWLALLIGLLYIYKNKGSYVRS
jgi:apolipoprotein N-acyltransferase